MASAVPFDHARFVRWLVVFVGLGAVIYLGGIVWAGWQSALEVMQRIGLPMIAGGAMLASSSYLLRFARWHYSLSVLGYAVSRWHNLEVYLSGLALTTSPGKLGETIRSVLLLPHGVQGRHSLGAFLADRLSDVLGVCMLGVLAGWACGALNMLMALAWVAVAMGSLVFRWVVLRSDSVMCALTTRQRFRWLKVGPDALLAWARLWTVPRMLGFMTTAFFAYGVQAFVFALFCAQVAMPVSFVDAMQIFAFATLFGAASMVPGGLGAMEAALVMQLVSRGADSSVAVSVAIATRLVTLWLGISIGAVAVLSASRRMKTMNALVLES